MSDAQPVIVPPHPEEPFPVPGHPAEPSPDRPTRLRVFKRLRAHARGPERVEHGMGTLPSVDLYRLDHFPVVASADGTTFDAWVNFYLHHTSDRTVTRPGGPSVTLAAPGTRLPLAGLLAEYGVPYDDRSSLGDLVTEFWKAFFAAPSDAFDETGYASSPWLDRCCGDRRTVREVKRSGGWDDLWLHFRPRKTVNHPRPGTGTGTDPRVVEALALLSQGDSGRALELLRRIAAEEGKGGAAGAGAPPPVEVAHVDYGTLALRLLPPYEELFRGDEATGEPALPETAEIDREEVPVMLLLHG